MELNNWPYKQRELLKTAIEATDGYLGVEKLAAAHGEATPSMMKDFIYYLTRAYTTLEKLGVVNDHTEYMNAHINVMTELEQKNNLKQEAALYKSSRIIPFNRYIVEEEQPTEDLSLSDEEITKIVDELTWDDIVDLYDEIELVYDEEGDDEEGDDELEEQLLDEKLTVQARLKKRQAFARMRGKRNVARGIKLRRASSIEVLKKRAVVAARRAVYKRFLRGRDKSSLSAAEKDRIEQQVGRMKYIQTAIATKMLPKMRSIEQKRLASYRGGKSPGTGTVKASSAPGGTKTPGRRR